MIGAGTLIAVIGAGSLLYLVLGRERLRRETQRRRTLPVLGELPFWLYVAVQVAGCLVAVALGIWLIASG
jgi:hypothetical protein